MYDGLAQISFACLLRTLYISEFITLASTYRSSPSFQPTPLESTVRRRLFVSRLLFEFFRSSTLFDDIGSLSLLKSLYRYHSLGFDRMWSYNPILSAGRRDSVPLIDGQRLHRRPWGLDGPLLRWWYFKQRWSPLIILYKHGFFCEKYVSWCNISISCRITYNSQIQNSIYYWRLYRTSSPWSSSNRRAEEAGE